MDLLGIHSKEKGVYLADWRLDSYLDRFHTTGRILSLRGTVGVNNAGKRRYLKNVPEKQACAARAISSSAMQAG